MASQLLLAIYSTCVIDSF